jgi:transmembrane sensor
MDIQKAQELLEKHRAGTLTPKEKLWLDHWYLELEASQPEADHSSDLVAKQKQVFARIDETIRPRTIMLWPRITAAASILIALGAGTYYFTHKEQQQMVVNQQPVKTDILPGTNAATLTLANGQKIVLTKTMTGQLAVQGQTKVQMNNGGTVTYTGSTAETIYNTLTTKRKQQFPLVLSDGTEVMLDAESSITYPVAFNGTERKVKVTGQAYFKVVHNDKQPFAVEVKGQTIRDIGTEFNINAYDDEPVVKTTLVEGIIAVQYKQVSKTLKPGQAAILSEDILTIKPGDIEEATAWKNNLFHFTGTDLKPLMRQLARWYDVDVSYQGKIPKYEFGGDMSRNVKASEVFEMLGKYGLKVKLDGKNLIISAK